MQSMDGSTDDTDAALVAELSEMRNPISNESPVNDGLESLGDDVNEVNGKKRKLKQYEDLLQDAGLSADLPRKVNKTQGETSEARRESHKIIEQKRRQKINDKINELRELLNYPDGSQNKAVVLQAAVDNIKNLKLVCSKLLSSHRQLQEDYLHVLAENERIRKLNPPIDGSQEPKCSQFQTTPSDKNGTVGAADGDSAKKHRLQLPFAADNRLPDLNMPVLYDESVYPTATRIYSYGNGREGFNVQGVPSSVPYGQDSVLHSMTSEPDNNGRQTTKNQPLLQQEQTVRT